MKFLQLLSDFVAHFDKRIHKCTPITVITIFKILCSVFFIFFLIFCVCCSIKMPTWNITINVGEFQKNYKKDCKEKLKCLSKSLYTMRSLQFYPLNINIIYGYYLLWAQYFYALKSKQFHIYFHLKHIFAIIIRNYYLK